MRIVQKVIGIGERVPLADAVWQAVIKFLVGQTRRRLSRAGSDADQRSPAKWRSIRSPRTLRPPMPSTTRFRQSSCAGPGAAAQYSCCLYDDGAETLEGAEERALRVTAEHAGLADGQHILELGCGWGSLSLWMAAHFPNAGELRRSRILDPSGIHRRRGE